MNLKRFVNSFRDAWKGVIYVYKHEQNFRLQIVAGLLVLIAGLFFNISRDELVIVLFLIFLVLGLELLNTILEKFLDLLKPRLNYQVKILKDITAAMVLLATFGSVIVGLVIFLPYVIEFWGDLML